MFEQLDELYREVILEHFKRSAHSGTLPDAQVRAEGANPLCGDELTFQLALDGGRITRARFQGKGCAISQAAASMLAAALEGRTPAEARRLIEAMKRLMHGDPAPSGVELGDLEALSGVRKFPVRIKCAALSWNVVEDGLDAYEQRSGGRAPAGNATEK
jgi:nitrogen fixation NifU-like protein